MTPQVDRNEVARAIGVLFKPGCVVEVRIPKTRYGTIAGYFDNHAAMAKAISDADAKYRPAGIYTTLNRIDPTLLARAYNRLKERAENLTADNNVTRRLWLPIDLDPVRPAGVSASDEEHASAIQRALTIASEMAPKWKDRPIVADSGNGAHLLYSIDEPNDSKALQFVSEVLRELARRYSDDLVKVDLTTANAARIWKVYGSVARKGDSIPGRPHRVSRILEVPVAQQ
jgi:hypothetical protein